MKVLIFSESSQPSRYWEDSLPPLRNKGIDVCFCTTRAAGEIHSRLEKRNIRAIGLGAKRAKDYPQVAYRLAAFIKAEKIDIVHASESIQATIAGLACVTAKNTKSIFHYHHTQVTGKQKVLSWVGSRLSDHVMAVSKAAQNATVKFDGTPVEKTTVAYNGIVPLREVTDLEKSKLRKDLGIPDNAKIIGIVARLRPEKGHRTLLEACEIVGGALPDPLHLIVVGDGNERDALESGSAEFTAFRCHFVGEQADVALWFSAMDVVAMPSYFEPFGLVAVEAMICGKALIASDVEGPAEIIENGVSGILVPPRDAASLAEAIQNMLCSPEYARELGENAKRRVLKNFAMENMVDEWIECYELVSHPTG